MVAVIFATISLGPWEAALMIVEIRTFTERDRAALRALFGRAGEGSPSSSLRGHEESEAAIYLTPYMDLEPESLLLAFVDAEMVGYLTGCLDSTRLPLAVSGRN